MAWPDTKTGFAGVPSERFAAGMSFAGVEPNEPEYFMFDDWTVTFQPSPTVSVTDRASVPALFCVMWETVAATIGRWATDPVVVLRPGAATSRASTVAASTAIAGRRSRTELR